MKDLIGRYAIAAVIILAILAVVYIFASVAGIAIPWWVPALLFIVLVAIVCVGVIKFLLSLG